jgi:hypothetical protein
VTRAVPEKPILFRGEMVRRILDPVQPKTQTRRIVKPQPPPISLNAHAPIREIVPSLLVNRGDLFDVRYDGDNAVAIRCPHGAPGDQLYVKEQWSLKEGRMGGKGPEDCWYAASNPEVRAVDGDGFQRYRKDGREASPWASSRFMPRWAARIFLEIADVRIDRLQSVTEEDAIAEGFAPSVARWWQGFVRRPDGTRGMTEGGANPDGPPPEWMESPELQTLARTARDEFAWYWDEINGPGSWAANPFVWAIRFRRIEP